jgi:ketosteroid isomerase-like protein
MSLVGVVAVILTSGLAMKLKAAPPDNQAAIRSLMDKWAAALRAKDLDALMSVYSPDVVAFDIVPPLQYKGREAYRSDFKQMLDLFIGPIRTEYRDLSITCGDNVGFSRYL